MHKFFQIAVSAAVLLLAIAAVAAQNGTAQVIGGDETALRELLARSLASYPAYEDSETTVLVGSLPDNLPVEFVLPDQMRVIGSIQRGALSPTEIYMDVPQPPEEVIAFFEAALNGDEWRLVDGFPGGGFTTMRSDSAFYCSDTYNALVSINAFGYDGGSDTRLYITPADAYLCAEADGRRTPDPYRLLPQLQTPDGVTLLQGGGGGGGGSGLGFQSVSTQAFLKSELAPDDILAAYNAQLEAVGWQPVGSESGEKLAWSGWMVAGDETRWAGTLTLTASPTIPDQYTAVLMLQETSATP